MQIMVDIETLSIRHDAVVLSIGMCTFDYAGVHEELYVKIDPKSGQDKRHIDAETVRWWMQQSEEARKVFRTDESVSVDAALGLCHQFVEELHNSPYGDVSQYPVIGVWGNGSDFDNVVLRDLFETESVLDCPWKFWQNRCYRTMKNMVPEIEMIRTGEHHNALDDAKSQAFHLIEIAEKLGIDL